MVNWGKRPEFTIPLWRKRLDTVILAIAIPLVSYQIIYTAMGLYYNEMDPEQERRNLRDLDDRINRMLFGKSISEMSETTQKLHKSLSLIELAAQIRDQQLVDEPRRLGTDSDDGDSKKTA